ncbi:MAG: PD-(D/E)XK nuclease family transposase, partial [Agathobacter sp.]
LNDNTVINLEMQMQNQRNWEERSLSYLCRSFDQLYQGQDYIEAKPAMHIGFLNFSPFSDVSEFYGTYKLMNVKNKKLYSDKFILSVIDLTHIELATEEDKEYQIDYWAKLFTATSWEELKMIAEKNESMEEATQTLYELNSDWVTQDKCRARREYYKRENTMKRDMERLKNLEGEKERLESEKEHLEVEKERLESEKEHLEGEKERLESDIAGLESDIAGLESNIAGLESNIAGLESNIAGLEDENSVLKNENEELRKRIADLESKK